MGGSHLYTYPLNPNQTVDPLGLNPVLVVPAVAGLFGIAATEEALENNSSSTETSVSSYNKSESDVKQEEYEYAKNFCDNKKPPDSDKEKNLCSTLSKQIDHADKCADLYEKWDQKWLLGRHAEKIESWLQRGKNLRDDYSMSCTKNKMY